MKTISHPLFLLVFASYVVYYILKHFHVSMPVLITSYYADLVSLFIINTVILFIIRRASNKPNYELPIAMVVFSFFAISAIFEFIHPAWDNDMVADPLDIMCYGFSALLYIIWRRNRKLV
tara:strand:- start:88981 stop:89340 length:360 start_codon:yes stop_codon:yes gene_type:complete